MRTTMKYYVVIEYFKLGKRNEIYNRLNTKGRMLSNGLKYVDSWIERDGNRCFQLMQAKNLHSFKKWISMWNDLIDFEIIMVESNFNLKKHL